MTKYLFAAWREFEEKALADAPIDQKVEMQKAFYFGAATLLSILQKIPDSSTEEEGAEVFEQLHRECGEYLDAAIADFKRTVDERKRGKGFGRGGR